MPSLGDGMLACFTVDSPPSDCDALRWATLARRLPDDGRPEPCGNQVSVFSIPSRPVVRRCAAGREPAFYATDRVAAGVQIEIYREEKDGWLAVRPPLGSFSLVERRQLKAGEEPGVAVVLAEDVLSCVGSRVEAVPTYVSQVRLRKDERVELLDKWDDEATAAELRRSGLVSNRAAGRRIPLGASERTEAGHFHATRCHRPRGTANGEPRRRNSGPATTPKTSFEADGWRTRPAVLAANPPRSTAPASGAADPIQASPATDAKQAAPTADAKQGWTAVPATAKPDEASQVDTAKASPQAKPTTPVTSQIRVPVDGEKLIGRPASESPAATRDAPAAVGAGNAGPADICPADALAGNVGPGRARGVGRTAGPPARLRPGRASKNWKSIWP